MAGTLASLVLVALAQPEAGTSPPPGTPGVVLVLRTGQLAREEVSPVETSPVTSLWSLALVGVTWTRLAPPTRRTEESSTEAFLRELDAPHIASALEAVGHRLATIDLAAAPPPVAPAGPIAELHSLFGSPAAPTAEEAAAVSALRRALSAAAPQPAAADEPEPGLVGRLRALAGATAAIVIVTARTADAAAIRVRNEELVRLEAASGAAAHFIVVNVPDEGEGCLVARGPRLKAGRVFAVPRTVRSIAGLAAMLLGGSLESELGPELRSEASVLLR